MAEPEIREMADVHSPLLHQQKSLLERLKNQGDDMDEEETRSSLIAAINCILPRLTTDTLETIYFTTDEHLKKQTLLDSSERLVIFT